MKYVITIIIIAFVLAIFAQTAITMETVENTGKTESATTTMRFAIGQPAIGQTNGGNITHQAGVLNQSKMTVEIERMPDVETLPKQASIGEPYPNPFNSNCRIEISLPKDADVSFEVFDLNGKKLFDGHHLGDGVHLNAGSYTINFDAGELPSGTYLYRTAAGQNIAEGKLILVR